MTAVVTAGNRRGRRESSVSGIIAECQHPVRREASPSTAPTAAVVSDQPRPGRMRVSSSLPRSAAISSSAFALTSSSCCASARSRAAWRFWLILTNDAWSTVRHANTRFSRIYGWASNDLAISAFTTIQPAMKIAVTTMNVQLPSTMTDAGSVTRCACRVPTRELGRTGPPSNQVENIGHAARSSNMGPPDCQSASANAIWECESESRPSLSGKDDYRT